MSKFFVSLGIISCVVVGLFLCLYLSKGYGYCKPWKVDYDIFFSSDDDNLLVDYGNDQLGLKSVEENKNQKQIIYLWIKNSLKSEPRMDIRFTRGYCDYNDTYTKNNSKFFLVGVDGKNQTISVDVPDVYYKILKEENMHDYFINLSYNNKFKTEVKVITKWVSDDEFEKLKQSTIEFNNGIIDIPKVSK